MNQKSGDTFTDYGGKELVGKSLYDCHNPKSIDIMKDLLANKKTVITSYSIHYTKLYEVSRQKYCIYIITVRVFESYKLCFIC